MHSLLKPDVLLLSNKPTRQHYLPAEGSPSDGAEAAGCKLFLFNLARTVTDADLGPLFAPFNPIYSCVAIGKKGGNCLADSDVPNIRCCRCTASTHKDECQTAAS